MLQESARKKYQQAIKTRCRKNKCNLNLNEINDDCTSTVLDADEVAKIDSIEHKICDYFVIIENGGCIFVCVEMKSKNVDASHVINQFNDSTNIISDLVGDSEITFRPIIIFQSGIHASELKVLKQSKISYKGRSHSIGFGRCGTSITSYL